MKKTFLVFAVIALSIPVAFVACKKDDDKSSDTTTTTTSSTSTTSTNPGPKTLVYEGTAISGVSGNCEFGSVFSMTGTVGSSDGASYTIMVDFNVAEPTTGTYKTVELPGDPITDSQCHLQLQRVAPLGNGTSTISMVAPKDAEVKVVKNGVNYTVSFGTIKFIVKQGSNGTRNVALTSMTCE
jgi:hypothetical protein